MKCKFSNRRQKRKEFITIAGEEVAERGQFRYLRYTIMEKYTKT